MPSDEQKPGLDSETLRVLREIRDGQREMITLLAAQHALAEERQRQSQAKVDESIHLQRVGLQRQRSITVMAIAGILACLAALAYLVLRYF